jgi:CubicO group peptidase (beta-lactamase class C family)
VTGFEESGEFRARLSNTVSKESAAFARLCGPGQDSPESYRSRPPNHSHDGIPVGNIAQSELGIATANAIVRGVLDGTYKDVHSVLLFQQARLVLEEYFYGYNAKRLHQLRSATQSVVSALAGIAIDRGALSGTNQPVLSQMTDKSLANPDPRKSTMTLGNFLSMSSGPDCNSWERLSCPLCSRSIHRRNKRTPMRIPAIRQSGTWHLEPRFTGAP